MLKKFFGPTLTKPFWKDLYNEISEDNVFTGAAALSYYLLFALFPALIFFLSLLPYLPIQNLQGQMFDLIHQGLPASAADAISSTLKEVTAEKRGGLLSFGALATLWAASAGLYAIMQQLDITYDVKEGRPFWKARGISILLTLAFGVMVIGAFASIIFGGMVQQWVASHMALGSAAEIGFAIFRYAIELLLLVGTFAIIYYFGPDVEQDFKFITPGAVFGVVLLLIASFAFRFYVENFGNYAASYGSLGAVIVLMLWLYIAGVMILIGSEINALIEHYSPDGKKKGEKVEGEGYTSETSFRSPPPRQPYGQQMPVVVRKPSVWDAFVTLVAVFMSYRLERSLRKKGVVRKALRLS
jgi:membrane protein